MEQYDADLAIIGSGPVGLAAALEAKKRGFKPIIFENFMNFFIS